MNIRGDYHMHTRVSDGHGSVADKYACAAARGIAEIAIADHGFGSFAFHQTARKFARQREDVERANAGGSVRVYQSIEANIVDDEGTLDVSCEVIARCDILHMGFHRFLAPRYVARDAAYVLVNGWAPRSVRENEERKAKNTRAYIAAMERYPVDVICHLNHRAAVDAVRVCDAAAELGVYVELNEKHIETLENCIEDIMRTGVKFILGSDAHRTDKTGLFPRVSAFVEKHGIPEERICGAGAEPVFRGKRRTE